MITLRKYPITYNNEIYEVRWEQQRTSVTTFTIKCIIYKVTGKKLLRPKLKYTKVFELPEKTIKHIVSLENDMTDNNDQNYLIKEVKVLFRFYESELAKQSFKQIQEEALAEWNGVIE